jgi:hypothetical protein
MSGNGKKTSQSRKNYYARASSVISKNKTKRSNAHARFCATKIDENRKGDLDLLRGSTRRKRREAWRKACPKVDHSGKPIVSFAKFEKREQGLSKWDSDHQLPKYQSTLSSENRDLLASIRNIKTIRLAA